MIVNCKIADHYTWGDSCDGWHLVRSPEVSIIQERMPAATAEVPHRHHHSHQFFFVLRGALTIRRETGSDVLYSGDGMHVDPGLAHEVRNDSEEDVEFLVTSWPPSHGDRMPV